MGLVEEQGPVQERVKVQILDQGLDVEPAQDPARMQATRHRPHQPNLQQPLPRGFTCYWASLSSGSSLLVSGSLEDALEATVPAPR